MSTLKKAELMQLVGRNVEVTLFYGRKIIGLLGYSTLETPGRKPNYFTVNEYDFKVSHVRKVQVVE